LPTEKEAGAPFAEESHDGLNSRYRLEMLLQFRVQENTEDLAARWCAGPGEDYHTYRRRAAELKKLGYIESTGRKLRNPSGKFGTVFRITVAGRRALKNRGY
jgi:hypothetical protein